MKAKYDIARLHKDCLAWCENPQWKPWMVEMGLILITDHNQFFYFSVSGECFSSLSKNGATNDSFYFAHFIGLDVESYRIPEIDRDQAVRDYLAGIPEGGELVDGWVKKTNPEPQKVIIWAVKGDDTVWLVDTQGKSNPLAYAFLRLDLRE